MDESRLMNSSLEKDFLKDYRKFVEDFDETYKDLFQGASLESLASDFLRKHRNYIDSFPFEYKFNYPNRNHTETIDEDHHILDEEKRLTLNKKYGLWRENETEDEKTIRQVMSDIYWRVSAANYLKITFNKCRNQKEEDRRQAVDFARFSIRYDSNSFKAIYWFMITLGWYIDNVKNPKERVLLGRVFFCATKRCMSLNPQDALAYHLSGRYYYNIACLSWLERTIAKGMSGNKIEGSYQDAERFLLQAHKINDWLPTGLWMARVLLAQQRPLEEVKKWLDFGLNMEPLEPTSEIERNEILELRAKLKLCSN